MPQDTLQQKIIDTVSDGSRDIYSGYSFGDSASVLRNPGVPGKSSFPWSFVSESQAFYSRKHEILIKSLKNGEARSKDQYKADWIVPLLFFSALLLGIVRSVPGNFFRNIFRFLTMRGINENASRDTGTLFQWQSTVMNLSAFLSISMFIYLALRYFEATIPGIGYFLNWLISLGGVILIVTLRHIICNITGNISDEQEIFREYIITIYQVYRFAGIVFLLFSFTILYVPAMPVKVLIVAGCGIAALLYLIRVSRLFLIFITRHVSILYFILYLCALEILPVVIIVKYVTGLV